MTILTILCTLGCSQGLGEVSGGATLGRFQFTLCMFGFFFAFLQQKKKKLCVQVDAGGAQYSLLHCACM